jgi:uncharacterized heparinase superfamily protein
MPSMTGPSSFVFLNEAGTLENAAGWNDVRRSKLWLYNLHYFDDLSAPVDSQRTLWHRNLISRWIVGNPPGEGNGWEPYPLSIRIVNWIKWALTGNTLDPQALASLSLQASALEQRIEWHILGNHLWANAKALIFAGAFFSGPEAGRWLHTGLAILEDELGEQILADGGHFERSPMYHAILLEDVLDLLNLGMAYPGLLDSRFQSRLAETANRMRGWLRVMCHPDGTISFFNDAAFAIAAEPAAIESYAARLGLRTLADTPASLTHLDPSGYVRMDRGGAVALLDCAPIGPDYLPGHAHADTLSFELSLRGERIIVNGGTSVYGTGPDRQRERATPAHSTVTVDEENSSEVWGGFRVARRARLTGVEVSSASDAGTVTASHDGYSRLKGRNIHTRTWRMSDCALSIRDSVTGPYRSAIARFHLSPAVTVTVDQDGRSGSIVTTSGARMAWQASTITRIEPSMWHPEFGKSLSAHCLALPLESGGGEITFSW